VWWVRASIRGLAAACFAAFALFALPARAADEIHWTITGPTSVTFDWRGPESFVQYGLTTSYSNTVTAVGATPAPVSSAGPFWEARLTGLIPDTVYHYSIGTGADHTFRTPRRRGVSHFTVMAAGDIGSSLAYPMVPGVQQLIADQHPAFTLMLGDLTYANNHGQNAVDQHFNDVMVWSQDAAYMPAWGNHEHDAPDDLRNYTGRFDLPNPQSSPGSPSAVGEDWSWFDYGNVRFISYPEPVSGAWSDWLGKATALMDEAQVDPAITFIVTFGHRPAYSSGHHPGSATLASQLSQLGAAHSKYRLNLNGHSHNYERTFPQSGVIHVTAGTGGSSLEQKSGSCLWPGGCPPPWWSAYRAFHHGAVRLLIAPQRITVQALCGPRTTSEPVDITCTLGSVIDQVLISSPLDSFPEPPGGFAFAPSVGPNPMNDGCFLRFGMARSGHARVCVMDAAGRIVRTLVNGPLERGPHEIPFDGRDHHNRRLPAGVYFYRVEASDRATTLRTVIVD